MSGRSGEDEGAADELTDGEGFAEKDDAGEGGEDGLEGEDDGGAAGGGELLGGGLDEEGEGGGRAGGDGGKGVFDGDEGDAPDEDDGDEGEVGGQAPPAVSGWRGVFSSRGQTVLS